jgi:hypothetical protein
MNFLKSLVSLFGGGGAQRADKRYLTIYVLSRRCNEPISGQVDLLNELSKPDEGDYAYYTRKVLHTSGEHRCFSQVEINIYFNQDKQIVHHEVEGGRWLTSEEYNTELMRFNAPAPEDELEESGAGQSTSNQPTSAENDGRD